MTPPPILVNLPVVSQFPQNLRHVSNAVAGIWVLVALAAFQVCLTVVTLLVLVVGVRAMSNAADAVRGVACQLNTAYCRN